MTRCPAARVPLPGNGVGNDVARPPGGGGIAAALWLRVYLGEDVAAGVEHLHKDRVVALDRGGGGPGEGDAPGQALRIGCELGFLQHDSVLPNACRAAAGRLRHSSLRMEAQLRQHQAVADRLAVGVVGFDACGGIGDRVETHAQRGQAIFGDFADRDCVGVGEDLAGDPLARRVTPVDRHTVKLVEELIAGASHVQEERVVFGDRRVGREVQRERQPRARLKRGARRQIDSQQAHTAGKGSSQWTVRRQRLGGGRRQAKAVLQERDQRQRRDHCTHSQQHVHNAPPGTQPRQPGDRQPRLPSGCHRHAESRRADVR